MNNDPEIRKIYITYKTRMITEARLRRYGVLSHLGLAYYSLMAIIFGLFQERLSASLSNDVLNAFNLAISVLLFGLSLIAYGFKFEERAGCFRECYLNLQQIWNSGASSGEKLNQYTTALKHYPNHADSDYEIMLFKAWLNKQTLQNADGDIPVTWPLKVKIFLRIAGHYVLVLIAILWPLYALSYII